MSCKKYKNRRDWQRLTWLPNLQFEYKFFVGSFVGEGGEEDVVKLPCSDDYNSLPEKVLEIVKWAYNNGFDRLLKTDDDVYIRPERLRIPLEDYTGHCYGHKDYASGSAYWLSRRAMEAILSGWVRVSSAEDMCVGETLRRKGIKVTEDHRYRVGWRSFKHEVGENEFPHPENDTITFHMYFPDQMVKLHENWTSKQYVGQVY